MGQADQYHAYSMIVLEDKAPIIQEILNGYQHHRSNQRWPTNINNFIYGSAIHILNQWLWCFTSLKELQALWLTENQVWLVDWIKVLYGNITILEYRVHVYGIRSFGGGGQLEVLWLLSGFALLVCEIPAPIYLKFRNKKIWSANRSHVPHHEYSMA